MSLSSVLKWIDISRLILPAILATAGVPAEHIPGIVGAVGNAEEALGPGTGAQKLAAVQSGLANVMQASGAAPDHIASVGQAVSDSLAIGVKVVNDVHTWHQTDVGAQAAPVVPPASGTIQ